MLADAQIRAELIIALKRRANKPLAIVEELRFHDGNAIADVVAVYKSMHAYEIKGAGDNVTRLRVQSPFYNTSFPFITLVTTRGHVSWAVNNLDAHWGIIEAYVDVKAVTRFRYVRKALPNPLFCKRLSLSMLWRDELLQLGARKVPDLMRKNDSREILIRKICPALSKQDSLELISNTIAKRSSVKEN